MSYGGECTAVTGFYAGVSAIAGMVGGDEVPAGKLDLLVFEYCRRYFLAVGDSACEDSRARELVASILAGGRERLSEDVAGVGGCGPGGEESGRHDVAGSGLGSVPRADQFAFDGTGSGGVAGGKSAVFGSSGGSWRGASVRGPVTLPRGPNFLRNQEARLRKRIAKEQRAASQSRGFFSGCADDVQEKLRESRARLLIAENERKLIEEQRKLKYLNSPMAAVGEAMRAIGVAEKLAAKENNSKVVGWAKTVTDSYASSISGTGPGSASSGSVSARSSVSQRGRVVEQFSIKMMPANEAEREVLAFGALTSEELEVGRSRVKRQLHARDFLRPDFPHVLDNAVKAALRRVIYEDNEFYRHV